MENELQAIFEHISPKKPKKTEMAKEAAFLTLCRECKQFPWCHYHDDPCKKWRSYRNVLKCLNYDQLEAYINYCHNHSCKECEELLHKIINIKVKENRTTV